MIKNTQQDNRQLYYATDEWAEVFYQFPKFLIISEHYNSLSPEAKIAYMLLKDRNSLSIKNGWVDENGAIYFEYTNKKLAEAIGVGDTKLKKVKKELIDFGLLKSVKRGFDPKLGKNLPNRLYLLKPYLTAEDVYKKEEKVTSALGTSGRSQNDHDLEEYILLKDSTNRNYRDTQEDSYPQNTTPTFDIFSNETNSCLNIIAKSENLTIPELKNTIFTAKNKALKDNGINVATVIDIKDYADFVTKSVRGLVNAIKSDKGVKKPKGYLYISIYKGFSKYAKLYNFAHKEGILDINATNTQEELDAIYHDLDAARLVEWGIIEHKPHKVR